MDPDKLWIPRTVNPAKLWIPPSCGSCTYGTGLEAGGEGRGVLWLLVFSKERIQSTDAEIGVRLSLKVRTTWRVLPFGF